MVCVYCLSYVPALLNLQISGYEGQDAKLMFYLVFVAQISDVMQYVWGKPLGRHKNRAHRQPQQNLGRGRSAAWLPRR